MSARAAPIRRRAPWALVAVMVLAVAPLLAQAAGTVVLPQASPRVRQYNQFWYVFTFAATAWGLIGMGLLVASGLGGRIRTFAERRTRVSVLRVAICYGAVSLLLTLWRRPSALVAYLVERSYGFATLGPGRWLLDALTGYLVGWVLYTPVIALGYWLLRRSPRRWWLWLWAATVPLALLAVVVYPVVIDPLYNHYRPMPPSPLRTRLLQLAARAGVPDAQVFVVDISRRTRKLNAYVTGLGPSKRIVVWDTTLQTLPPDQVVAIVGHEMGHYVLHHIWWGFLAACGGSLILLWLFSRLYPWAARRFGGRAGVRDAADLAGLPIALLVLSVLLFVQEPAASAISRVMEHQADRYGLDLTHLNVPTARAFVAFTEHDYADPDPPAFITFWEGTHPPLRERVNFALSYHPWLGGR